MTWLRLLLVQVAELIWRRAIHQNKSDPFSVELSCMELRELQSIYGRAVVRIKPAERAIVLALKISSGIMSLLSDRGVEQPGSSSGS